VSRLAPGDPVAVVAPSGPFESSAFEQGLAILAQRYQPRVAPHARDTHRYLAGRDDDRAADLQHALDDGDIKAVFAARGGYGAARLLPSLRLGQVHRPLVGFSDTTALHLALQARGVRSVHGPVVTQLAKSPAHVIERLFTVLEGGTPAPLSGTRTVVRGRAEGPLLGGNLSVLTRLIGTPYLPSLRGCVLLLEDVGERPYRLDRMWTHLKLAGLLEGLAGVVFGEFTGCEDAAASSAMVLDELAQALGVPCLAGLRIGHGDENHAVPLGARVRLDTDEGQLTFLEGLGAP
jgi:muramoyltetrapeptide carboxypeptidase